MKNKKSSYETSNIKSVVDIRDEFFDNNKLSSKSLNDLAWHIENNFDPQSAISLVADAHLLTLVPLIAKHLDHDDDYIRELAVGCILGQLKISEYAEKALNMALNDPNTGPRALATANLGDVINDVDVNLQKRIASYLYDVMVNASYDGLERRFALESILEAMNIPMSQWNACEGEETYNLLKNFKEKYDF